MYDGPGRSISTRETVSAGLPIAAACARRRRMAARLLGRRPVRRHPGRHEHDAREAELPGRLLAEQQVPEVHGVAERRRARRRAVSSMLTTRDRPPRRSARPPCATASSGGSENSKRSSPIATSSSGLDARVAQRLDHAEAAELDRERAHALGRREVEPLHERDDLAARDAHDAVVAHQAEQALPRARGR